MTYPVARRRAAAAALALVLAMPAAVIAAPRAPRADGWLATLWGGLERIFAAEGGCIDPDGARCLVQPTTSATSGLCVDAASRPVACPAVAAGASHDSRSSARPSARGAAPRGR